jgi:monoamine oxidase
MKTIISFNKKFWNQRNLIFTDDPCINQIWMMANTKDEFFVTAFTVAESVGNYKKIKNPEKYFVDLLDKIFENQASKYFVRLVEQYDWTTNEFIKGGIFFIFLISRLF